MVKNLSRGQIMALMNPFNGIESGATAWAGGIPEYVVNPFNGIERLRRSIIRERR